MKQDPLCLELVIMHEIPLKFITKIRNDCQPESHVLINDHITEECILSSSVPKFENYHAIKTMFNIEIR